MEIIGTTKVSNEIEELLYSAEEYLILVSPYLKINDRLKVRLSDTFKRVKKIIIIYRYDGVRSYELNWFKKFDNVRLYSIKNLHAKIYVNDEFCLISSMNLYEYSQINNHEIGVKFTYNDYQNQFKNILNEIRLIIETEYENHNFYEIFEYSPDYSMSKLYFEIWENYTFDGFTKGQRFYEWICRKAIKIITFKEDDFYSDKSAILRTTPLSKENYLLLKKELIKYAN